VAAARRLEGSEVAEIGVVLAFFRVVFWIGAESGCDQAGVCANRALLTITRLARANRVRSCAVFLASPR
jgi:hypothetical protein